ncbi:transmembrane protein 26-like [Dendropsophus ebraccatus]|uniref:transmembrane protein 26-like n=1 Tax=Dendropsophus ebraccatus TaxID=150705 RepID=UPI003831933C
MSLTWLGLRMEPLEMQEDVPKNGSSQTSSEVSNEVKDPGRKENTTEMSEKEKKWRKLLIIVSYIFFTVHGVMMVYVVEDIMRDKNYWALLTGVILMIIYGILRYQEKIKMDFLKYKWFSPMVFLYLCTVIPSIIVVESHNLILKSNKEYPDCTNSDHSATKQCKEMRIYEESIFLTLVAGRWLMSRGENRDQLGQFLLKYFILGADILDILDFVQGASQDSSHTVTWVGLGLFAWSMMQFPFMLTESFSVASLEEPPSKVKTVKTCIGYLPPKTVSKIAECMTLITQDVPFLVYRLYLTAREGLFFHSLTFFIIKNILSIAIHLYSFQWPFITPNVEGI